MNKDSSPVQRLPKVTDGFNIRVAYCIFRPRNALLRCLLRLFYISHERSRALAGAKFGPRGTSWSRTRTISRRLAGAVKGIAMTSEPLTYFRSRAPFIGAARHVQTCWYAFPNTLWFYVPKNIALKEKVSKLCELLVNMHLKSFPNILTALYRDNSPLRFSGSGCHPWLQPSVLQEPRVFLIQCLSLIKLKHMPARYWLLVLGVS